MPRQTKQQRLITILETRGYRRQTNPRSSRYVEMVLGPGGKSLLKEGYEAHRVLVGRAGALRHTRGAIDQSVPFSDPLIKRLLGETS